MSDSLSNLVHRPTLDQFTEGMAFQVSFQAWALVAQRGEGSVEGRMEGRGREGRMDRRGVWRGGEGRVEGGEKSYLVWCPQGGCAMA